MPRFGWRSTFIAAIVPALLVFGIRRFVPESARYAALALGSSRERLTAIPGAWRRIVVGWLLYIPNAAGYWGISVFLTSFMVRKFHASPQAAIFYGLCFYVVQFVLCYVATALSDMIAALRQESSAPSR